MSTTTATARAVEPRESPPYPLGPPERLDLAPGYGPLLAAPRMTRVRMPYGGDAWLAVRYEHVREVMSCPHITRELVAAPEALPRRLPEPPPGGSIMTMDGAEHARLRRLVNKAFTARRIEAMRADVQRLVDGLLDGMEAAGPPVDLVEALAVPLPVRVICALMGIPADDHERFRSFTETIMGAAASGPDAVRTAMGDFFAYFSELIAQRRAEPTDDLLGGLVLARDKEDRLSEQELVWLGIALLIGGHETTLNQIANFSYTLLTHPEALEDLRAHPEITPRAVEELLRYIPTGAGSARAHIATDDVELGGVTVRAGEGVVVDLGAANFDAAVFAQPHRLDLRREPNHHLAMGHSSHFCLGAQLARMELSITLTSLLRRFPGLRLAIPVEELQWNSTGLIRGLARLPVAW
ncbi:cytochrome P450 [Streptomyces iconiensis]|uniref:Cytochrome P450 n=1 Tax=Streptomyces iconiensis TaxID=1384038 RepID=A0ABT6ZY56_9ACTN|nr:cytochrome P450 [Streptomyces iconiensis]MDJ1134000.1 cytochrome P450 [Streptomyces iconiensis]